MRQSSETTNTTTVVDATKAVETSNQLISQMTLEELARQAIAESDRFYRGRQHDTRFAYELFRRALVERNELAWGYIYEHFSSLVEHWVRNCGAFARSGESGEFFVGAAFLKFWRAITPERFASFPNLASLLQYLQLCATCVVIDNVRTQAWGEMLPEDALADVRTMQADPDEAAVDHVSREEFWRYINAQLHTEAERVVVFASFVQGMKPGDIYKQRPDVFAGISQVYSVKRNVLERLGRNQELQRMVWA